MMKRIATLALVAVGTIALGCDDGSGGDIVEAGQETLLVVLETPMEDDGALLLTIDAPTPPTVQAASSIYSAYAVARSDGSVGAAVIGDINAGPLLLLHFAADTDPADVQVRLVQVADRANELRANSDAYSLEVVRP